MTLKLIEISGGYGQRLVHENISIDAASGEVIAIIGRNGTGKTTLARVVLPVPFRPMIAITSPDAASMDMFSCTRRWP